jgi:hypothetical protein
MVPDVDLPGTLEPGAGPGARGGGAALGRLAEGLLLGRTGEYRDRLMRKQAAVLRGVQRREQQAYLVVARLVSKDPSKQPPDAAAERGAAGGELT